MNTVTILIMVIGTIIVSGQQDFENYHVQLREIMDSDMLIRDKRFEDSTNQGSGDDDDRHELTPDQLTAAEIMAIVVCSVIGLALVLFVSSCFWYKMRRPHRPFIAIDNNDDESMLYMVDYDEVSIKQGQLQVHISSTQTTPSKELLTDK
ncbi:uncharacterized protein LOC143464603 [Clavelina lepadiformis]|uniref:Uncharacterized protein n=1 Tax=Clavelina lepadiformis TaxID=159417 RepID=A0ABP0EYA0_CLALP